MKALAVLIKLYLWKQVGATILPWVIFVKVCSSLKKQLIETADQVYVVHSLTERTGSDSKKQTKNHWSIGGFYKSLTKGEYCNRKGGRRDRTQGTNDKPVFLKVSFS